MIASRIRRGVSRLLTVGDPFLRAEHAYQDSQRQTTIPSLVVERLHNDNRAWVFVGCTGAAIAHAALLLNPSRDAEPMHPALIGFGALTMIYYSICMVRALPAPRKVEDTRPTRVVPRTFRPERLIPGSLLLMVSMGLQAAAGPWDTIEDALLNTSLVGLVLTQLLFVVGTTVGSQRAIRMAVTGIKLFIAFVAGADFCWMYLYFRQGDLIAAVSLLFTSTGIAVAAAHVNIDDTHPEPRSPGSRRSVPFLAEAA